MENILNKIQKLCHGIEYSRHIPDEAEQLAKENGIVVIVGGSDDLMYCYGADCYLTKECEHGYGWDGEDLTKIKGEKKLKKEAKQLGLKIWWCGNIKESTEHKLNYSTEENGAFSYSVNEDIQHLEFLVCENENDFSDIYCTGIIIKLPDNFKPSI
ncbi:hypothetical protein CLU96_1248 [Chryseobacterium sp. 52]|uniref:hypothetical protein n=1 Tax=Chryseobacterium sp. 52 TaxID=2035213 RepID=UPI000C1930F1|nr:hypothetical protein [Chryseobacterium sp. 52]PIF44307.1 hypothetical protein CLU96_1248 [Chryseobacterium sp. 52]